MSAVPLVCTPLPVLLLLELSEDGAEADLRCCLPAPVPAGAAVEAVLRRLCPLPLLFEWPLLRLCLGWERYDSSSSSSPSLLFSSLCEPSSADADLRFRVPLPFSSFAACG